MCNDNRPTDWPEHSDRRYNYDSEIHKCPDCNIKFFGYKPRLKCFSCAFKGVLHIQKIKL